MISNNWQGWIKAKQPGFVSAVFFVFLLAQASL